MKSDNKLWYITMRYITVNHDMVWFITTQYSALLCDDITQHSIKEYDSLRPNMRQQGVIWCCVYKTIPCIIMPWCKTLWYNTKQCDRIQHHSLYCSLVPHSSIYKLCAHFAASTVAQRSGFYPPILHLVLRGMRCFITPIMSDFAKLCLLFVCFNCFCTCTVNSSHIRVMTASLLYI